MVGSSYDATSRTDFPPFSPRKIEQRSSPNASPSLRAIACRMSMRWSARDTSLRISMTARRCWRPCSSSAMRAASRSPSALVRAEEMVMGSNIASSCSGGRRAVASVTMRTFPLAIAAAVLSFAPLAAIGAQTPAAAGPIGRYDVVPALPGMGRAPDTAATAARRRALMRRIGHGAVLIPAARERDLEKDYVQGNDFRQWNTCFYFTELETQDAWLLMTISRPDSLQTVLFLPPREPSQERWTGLRLGPDSTAARLPGTATLLPLHPLERRLASARFRNGGPIYIPLDEKTRDDRPMLRLTVVGIASLELHS